MAKAFMKNFKEWWFLWTSFILGIIFAVSLIGMVYLNKFSTISAGYMSFMNILGYMFVANGIIVVISAVISITDKKIDMKDAFKLLTALINFGLFGVAISFASSLV
jgi:hypothetical protein